MVAPRGTVLRMQGAPSLAVHGLSRRYGRFEALRDLELEVAPGECVAIVGHNGSGKTTAVRTIAGLLEPSAGRVEVAGAEVHTEPSGIEARAVMAVVPDNPSLYPDLTVHEHLELVALAHGVAGDDLDARIDALLFRLDLGDKRHARPGSSRAGCGRSSRSGAR